MKYAKPSWEDNPGKLVHLSPAALAARRVSTPGLPGKERDRVTRAVKAHLKFKIKPRNLTFSS